MALLELKRGDPKGTAQTCKHGAGTARSTPGARTPTVPRSPSALPGKSPAAGEGRRRPGARARPSGPSIRALFAPTWSPKEPWRAGSAPGAGPGRRGGAVAPEEAGHGRGGARRSAQAPPDALSRIGGQVGTPVWARAARPPASRLHWSLGPPPPLLERLGSGGAAGGVTSSGARRPLPPTSGIETWDSPATVPH